MSERIRYPAGLLGTYYATRHSLKSYLSCAVAATYSIPSSADVQQLLTSALHLTVETNSILRYGVSDPPNSSFILQEFIDFSSILKIFPTATWTSDDRSLTEALEHVHGEMFTDPEHIPSWRVRVVPYDTSTSKRRIEVIFVSHHAIADGLSCLAFHDSLFSHLQTIIQSGSQNHANVYLVPRDSAMPDLIENYVSFLPPASEPAINITDAILPPSEVPWPNTKCPVATSGMYQSRVLMLSIPPEQLTRVLAYCKANGTTFTGIIHGMLVSELVQILPDAKSFAAISPYSLRSLTGVNDTAIVNHVSYTKNIWSAELVSALRESIDYSEEKMGAMLMIARLYRAQVTAELLKFSKDNPLCKLAGLRNIFEYCKLSLGFTRTLSYELSNLGAMKNSATVFTKEPIGRDQVTVERCVFTQSGMLDPPIGVNTVSCGGGMVLTFTWREGAVDNEVMVRLRDGMGQRFNRLDV